MQIGSFLTIFALLGNAVLANPIAQNDDGVICTAILRNCFVDDCEPVFASEDSVSGTCTKMPKGCSCYKCSVEPNVNCSQYECVGVYDEESSEDVCAAGKYQGCACYNGIVA